MTIKKDASGRKPPKIFSPKTSPLMSPLSGPAEAVTTASDRAMATTNPNMSTARKERDMDTMMKTTEEMTSFSHGNVEAIMKSGQAWAIGWQAISQSIADAAQMQFDHTMSTWRAITNARSLKEAIDLQTSLARTSFEAAMTETGKLTEASIKLTEQAIAPLAARVTLAVEKLTHQVH